MLGKTITYKDFNNQDVEDTFYFNLTPAEATELNIREDLRAVGNSGNANRLMDTFKRILRAAYGVRLAGGARFIKTDQDWHEFVASNAYSKIFMQLVTDDVYAAAFIRELIPADMADGLPQNPEAAKNPETARANSEANMQGYNKPSESIAQAQQFQAPAASHENYTSRREAMNFEQGTFNQGNPQQ
jgi:hypothetical protein